METKSYIQGMDGHKYPIAKTLKSQNGLKREIVDLCLNLSPPDDDCMLSDFLFALQHILDKHNASSETYFTHPKAKTAEEIETVGKQLANSFTPFMDSRLSQTDVDKITVDMGKAIDRVFLNLEAQNKELREALEGLYKHAPDPRLVRDTSFDNSFFTAIRRAEQALKEDKQGG